MTFGCRSRYRCLWNSQGIHLHGASPRDIEIEGDLNGVIRSETVSGGSWSAERLEVETGMLVQVELMPYESGDYEEMKLYDDPCVESKERLFWVNGVKGRSAFCN